MRKSLIILGYLLFTACPLVVGAQAPPAFNYVNFDSPGPGGHPLVIEALTSGGDLAVNESGLGALSYRLDAAHTPTAVTCPGFPRYAHASRGGPFVRGMRDPDRAVVGDDEGVDSIGGSRSYGILQFPDGTCTAYLHPGSVGTVFTGISHGVDPVPFVVGYYWNPEGTPGEPGLLRFHAFLTSSAGTVVLDGPGPNTRNYPTGWNSSGQVILYSQENIDPTTNFYTYQAKLWSQATGFVPIDSPAGRDVCLRAINEAGVVLLNERECGVTAGKAYWLDTATMQFYELPLPTPDTVILEPHTVRADGAHAGIYVERKATGFPPPGDVRLETHGYIALPVVAPPAPKEKPPKDKKEKKGREKE